MHLLWTFQADGPIESSPALSANGKLYFGTNGGRVYAVGAALGTKTWSRDVLGGIKSSPAISAEQTMIVGSDLGKLLTFR